MGILHDDQCSHSGIDKHRTTDVMTSRRMEEWRMRKIIYFYVFYFDFDFPFLHRKSWKWKSIKMGKKNQMKNGFLHHEILLSLMNLAEDGNKTTTTKPKSMWHKQMFSDIFFFENCSIKFSSFSHRKCQGENVKWKTFFQLIAANARLWGENPRRRWRKKKVENKNHFIKLKSRYEENGKVEWRRKFSLKETRHFSRELELNFSC